MISEQQQFLEQLTDPLKFGVQKACVDFHNTNERFKEIYDLRILQVNELEYYQVVLTANTMGAHIGMVNDFVDMLEEYTPNNTTVTYQSIQDYKNKFQRTFYIYDNSLIPRGLL